MLDAIDNPAFAAAVAEARPDHSGNLQSGIPTIGKTFRELSAKQLAPREYLLYGLERGQYGIVNAINNHGKTLWARNLSLSIICGRAFKPFIERSTRSLRVAYIDLEDGDLQIRRDIDKMVASFDPEEKEKVRDNLLIISADDEIDGQSVKLSNEVHFRAVLARLADFDPDLIVIDTTKAAFTVRNENDNAEISRVIAEPMRLMAKKLNAGILILHHIGKQKSEDGETKELSHKGRGASAFSDAAKLIVNLSLDRVSNVLTIECGKIKDKYFSSTTYSPDHDTRWLQYLGEIEAGPTAGELVKAIFDDGEPHSTAACVEVLKNEVPERTVKRYLALFEKQNVISKIERGIYVKESP